MTGDETGGIGCEKDRSANEFLDLAEATHWSAKQEFFATLGAIEQRRVQIGAKDAGSKRVDANTRGGPFNGKRLGEGSHGGFTGAVSGYLKKTHERRERGDVNDTAVAALDHVAAEDAACAQSSRQIRFEDGIPLGLGKIERGHFLGAARAIHKNLDAAEFGADRLQQALDAGVVGDIAGLREGAAANRGDLPGSVAHQ